MDAGLNMLADIKGQVEYPSDAHDVSHTKSIQNDAGYFLVFVAEEITLLTMGFIECCTSAHMTDKFFSVTCPCFLLLLLELIIFPFWQIFGNSIVTAVEIHVSDLANKQDIAYIVKALKF